MNVYISRRSLVEQGALVKLYNTGKQFCVKNTSFLPSTEEEGRDLSCCVASLIQVLLDPHFRTIAGFQSLIQKEWVMAGHPFLDRCNHLKKSDKEVIG